MAKILRCLVCAALAFALAPRAHAQEFLGSAFNYQGKLIDEGELATGIYDMHFDLVTSEGFSVAPTVELLSVLVTDGIFNVTLDFGPVFSPEALYLHIAVRRGTSIGPYIDLAPDQLVAPTPVALTALGPWAINPLTAELTYPNNIGIGVTDPLWPIDVRSTQGIIRLTSIAAANGSVLELRNNTTGTPSLLGALAFTDKTGTTVGRIGYTGLNEMTFQVSGVERLRIESSGRLTIPTAERWVSLPPAAFVPGTAGAPYTLDEASLATDVGFGATYYAPLRLPDGVVVTEIIVDAAIPAGPMVGMVDAQLVRYDLATRMSDPLVVVDFAGLTGEQSRIGVFAQPETIDNSTGTYTVRVTIATPEDAGPARLYGVRVRYEVTTPLP
ncbi:MAG: hypothetical protein R3B49_08085 [Phycisphaerales bacterium]